jgi:hypothetical protein
MERVDDRSGSRTGCMPLSGRVAPPLHATLLME